MKPKFKTVLTALLLAVSLPSMAATHVLMETDMGNIRLVLDESKAPKTVANFVRYARKGFYDDTVFHRVIDGFVIQGGGLTEDLAQKASDKAVANESGNGLKNTAGTIAMARTTAPRFRHQPILYQSGGQRFARLQKRTIRLYRFRQGRKRHEHRFQNRPRQNRHARLLSKHTRTARQNSPRCCRVI